MPGLTLRRVTTPSISLTTSQYRSFSSANSRSCRALASWALVTPAPFRERLGWFWANHFTVSIRGGGVAATAGAYLREAIRPHVTGKFADMLSAVMHHPTMLVYLDNAQSVGPDETRRSA